MEGHHLAVAPSGTGPAVPRPRAGHAPDDPRRSEHACKTTRAFQGRARGMKVGSRPPGKQTHRRIRKRHRAAKWRGHFGKGFIIVSCFCRPFAGPKQNVIGSFFCCAPSRARSNKMFHNCFLFAGQNKTFHNCFIFCCAPSRPNTTKNNCVVFVPCPASGTLVPPQPIGNKTRHNPPHTTKHNWVIFVPCLASGTLVPPQPTKHNKEQLYHFCALPCLGNPSTPTTHRKQNSPQPTKHNDVQLCRFCALPCHPGPPTTHQTQRGTTVSFLFPALPRAP